MSRSAAHRFLARMGALHEATAFVEEGCTRLGVARGDALRLALIVEELFTNTVRHGHGGDCDAEIVVALRVEDDEVSLEYEDDAPPFDPLAHLRTHPPALDAGAEARAPGGLGIALVVRLAARVGYARVDTRNRVCVALRRAG